MKTWKNSPQKLLIIHNQQFFSLMAWLPKRPFLGRNRNFIGSPCLLSTISLYTMINKYAGYQWILRISFSNHLWKTNKCMGIKVKDFSSILYDFYAFLHTVHKGARRPILLYLSFEKSSLENQVRRTGFLTCKNQFRNWFCKLHGQ